MTLPALKSNCGKSHVSLHLTNGTGFILSIQDRPGCYGSNYSAFTPGEILPTTEVEIAILDSRGNWVLEDQVAGYVPLGTALEFCALFLNCRTASAVREAFGQIVEGPE